ncbi:MAG: hypothetical protein WD871_10415 [Xanthobacteraceae bacterium]
MAEKGIARFRFQRRLLACLLAAGLLLAAAPCLSQGEPRAGASAGDRAAAERYLVARRAFEEESAAYWRSVAEKRRIRNAKRRDNEPILLADYVLEQPPVYSGPPRPPVPGVPPEPRRPEIPVVADFLKAAAEQFGFVPRRPENELAFKRAYARAALDAGLTREQAVGVYIFETGGNGSYDTQAGLTGSGTRAISPALGYNQLLSTNSVGLLAEHGDRLVELLARKAEAIAGAPKAALHEKIAALRRMVAFSRTVPNQWSEHDKLAKTTPGGLGIHAAVLDLDIGPWLQTRKLVNSVLFARAKGYGSTLSAAELELMNFTGDGNGIDMVLMPADLRRRVPTANFFQQEGYERNPIARRTGTVAALIASIEARADRAARADGARELAAAFDDVASGSVGQR